MAAGSALHQDRSLRHDLLVRLADARKHTDRIFELVRGNSAGPSAIYDRPIRERHRLIFYVGHLEAFDWNLLGQAALHRSSPRESLDKLFAFGIDPTGGDLPTDQPSDWPSLTEVHNYRKETREAVDECAIDPGLDATLMLNVAIEHRLMHGETLAYLLHQLPLDRKALITEESLWSGHKVTPHSVRIPAGNATLGLERGSFGWDNEFESHTVPVPAFSIDAFNVTNEHFLEFIAAGGYQNRALWSEGGWNWIQREGITHPGFWVRREPSWHYRAMFSEIRLPPDWPVYVSHAEASAYAKWKGKQLPTEAQFHRAAYGRPDGKENAFPWGYRYPEQVQGTLDFRRWDPAPVGSYPDSDSAFGVSDMVGNGWEWTSTLFEPFPGFEPFSFYRGYSADFFDGKHYVMKGGSARTAACMLRRSFRNWFQPLYPHVYAGFRCVEN
jgi:iron(II)-dependent oxidoreductase